MSTLIYYTGFIVGIIFFVIGIILFFVFDISSVFKFIFKKDKKIKEFQSKNTKYDTIDNPLIFETVLVDDEEINKKVDLKTNM